MEEKLGMVSARTYNLSVCQYLPARRSLKQALKYSDLPIAADVGKAGVLRLAQEEGPQF